MLMLTGAGHLILSLVGLPDIDSFSRLPSSYRTFVLVMASYVEWGAPGVLLAVVWGYATLRPLRRFRWRPLGWCALGVLIASAVSVVVVAIMVAGPSWHQRLHGMWVLSLPSSGQDALQRYAPLLGLVVAALLAAPPVRPRDEAKVPASLP